MNGPSCVPLPTMRSHTLSPSTTRSSISSARRLIKEGFNQEDRLSNLGTLVDVVAANGPLRLPRDEALETVWALTSPELHQLLVRVRGWTRERYGNWLSESLSALLLEPERPRSRKPPRPSISVKRSRFAR